MDSVSRLFNFLNHNSHDTKIMPVESNWLLELETKYSRMPEDLRRLYTTLGYGPIAGSSYMIHIPTEPIEIYDDVTAENLKGILIVGDDFAGNCEAYNTNQDWVFGTIGFDGRFE
ncbi:hypothetical protein [Gimesia sp.]|uniref:hypothetical protein n=1 Tax=Gimesia sp. TaxID=2024833 RepID=UPI003A8FF9BE